MAKEDVVSAGVAAVQAGQTQVVSDQLGVAYDAGDTEGYARGKADGYVLGQEAEQGAPAPEPAPDETPYSQADLDKAASDAAAVVQAKLDEETALENASEATIASLRSVLAQIEALAAPSPEAPKA